MKNSTIGKIGAAITGVSVAAFALAMLIEIVTGLRTASVSYFVCIFIAVGTIIFSAAIIGRNKDKQTTAAGLAGIAFAVVYAVLIFIVYYAMLTTVRLNQTLSDEAMSIINYERLGSLFFNYDLLGYGFMALSTFFVGFTVNPVSNGDRVFQRLLWIHGVFFLSCLIIPMTGAFSAETSPVFGMAVLEVWCVYFLPVCILGWKYFRE